MPLHTVEPQRLYRQIAEQLRALVSAGEFEVGHRLPAERDLAVQLGVSRPSVREALIALEPDLILTGQTRPELLGGIRVKVGSDVWDGSVKARLESLKASLA